MGAERRASLDGRVRNPWKWIVIATFGIAALIVILVPLWQTAFQLQPSPTTASAISSSDVETIVEDSSSSSKGGSTASTKSEKNSGEKQEGGVPVASPHPTIHSRPVASPQDYSFVLSIPSHAGCSSTGKGQRRLHSDGRSLSHPTVNVGDSVLVGGYLVDLVSSNFGNTGNVVVTGFPPGSATISGDGIDRSSVSFSSVDMLATLTLTHVDTADYVLSINNRLSIPVFVLPVASKPTLTAPPNIVDDEILLTIHRIDPLERLSIELRVGNDLNGHLLGSVVSSSAIPGIRLKHLETGIYRFDPEPTSQSPEAIEDALRHLFSGDVTFVPNPTAGIGGYAEGIHVIATSTEVDGDGQVATASSAIFLPVSIMGTLPTASPVASDSVRLVEDVPKAVGSDIKRLILKFLPSANGSFHLSGFPAGSYLSFEDNGTVRHVQIHSPEDTIVFPSITELESLIAAAPAQSDEDFELEIYSAELEATLNVPVYVLAVADKPFLLVQTPLISHGGASIPVSVIPALGDDDDGSECLAVEFQVANDLSTQQPIGRLELLPLFPIPGVMFNETGTGSYRADASGNVASLHAAALRLLLASGSITFTPSPGVFGDYTNGLVVTVLSEEKTDVDGLAPNNSTGAGTEGDEDTSVEITILPVRVVILDNASTFPRPNPTNLPTMSSAMNPVTQRPNVSPSAAPVAIPTSSPTRLPITNPSEPPIISPSEAPVAIQTNNPTRFPVTATNPSEPPIIPPSKAPVAIETISPTRYPVTDPTELPSSRPSKVPIGRATKSPSLRPISTPTSVPSSFPSSDLTFQMPTITPSNAPTRGLPSPMPSGPMAPSVPDYRVTLGASNDFTSSNGDTWVSDIFSTGVAVDECASSSLIGIMDRGLYCTYRQWNSPTTGPLLLPSSIPGYYKVTLYFTETTAVPGERVVDIFIQGYRIFTSIDIASLVGIGVFTLDVTGFSSDGTINIEIVATTGFPILTAIEREYVPTAVAPFHARVNSGSTTSFVDQAGNTWLQDVLFTGGSSLSTCPAEINNTGDDEIFCSERFGSFSYSLPVPGFGFYHVVLYFAELFCKCEPLDTLHSIFFRTDDESGLRVFNVLANGNTIVENLDIFEVAGNFTALVLEATIQISGFSLSLDFQGIIESPKISGFEIMDVTGTFLQPTLINCGGLEFVDANNRVWMADTYFTGGSTFFDSTFAIDSTVDDTLYHSERNGVFSYNIPVSTGIYTVILSFAELFWDAPNQRLFEVQVQNNVVSSNFDIFLIAGGNLTALQLSIANVAAVDGFISIECIPSSPVAIDQPKLSAIEVIGQ